MHRYQFFMISSYKIWYFVSISYFSFGPLLLWCENGSYSNIEVPKKWKIKIKIKKSLALSFIESIECASLCVCMCACVTLFKYNFHKTVCSFLAYPIWQWPHRSWFWFSMKKETQTHYKKNNQMKNICNE